jgi:tripartite-type tricarboxylate transporter receptor subunit TctC
MNGVDLAKFGMENFPINILPKLIVLGAISCAAITSVFAQAAYPLAPIKIVVPVSAGGAPDVMARIVSEKLAEKFNQPVIVENRPGGGERIGASHVAAAPPDGYTLLATPAGSLAIAPHLYPKLGYDPDAFVPISILTRGHIVLVSRASLPAQNLEQLVSLAKASPGKLTYATPGAGTPPQLTGELFKAAAGIKTTDVPYKGLAPAVTDLLAGNVDFMFDNLANSLGHIKEGRLKAFGIAGIARIAELPDLSTIVEHYPAVHANSWFAMVAPPATPEPIAVKLSQTIHDVLELPEVKRKLRSLALEPVGSSPAEMAAFLKQESQRWRALILEHGIKPTE